MTTNFIENNSRNSPMKQFSSFLTPENFQLAFMRLQTAPRNLYKEIYHDDLKVFGLFLDDNIKSLISEIEQNLFEPKASCKIFIPKKNNLARPLSTLIFNDLLVYQAIINTIADSVYDEIIPYYNNLIFGNVYRNSKDKDNIFFYKPWHQQWKQFAIKTKEFYEAGYIYFAEFDIASFFDTIDHFILQQILREHYSIDAELVDFLLKLLEVFTIDSGQKTFKSKHGIPQGPIGSSFLADLYLLHLDLEMRKVNQSNDVKSIRYVDDIRIFSKNEIDAQKTIAYLDLFARDLGLIPQASKITKPRKIYSLVEIIKHQENNFSQVSKEFQAKEGALKSKTHRKLFKKFQGCFDPTKEKDYLDKTIISFALYKLNADESVKEILLREWSKLYTHLEGILFYLKKHFPEDKDVKYWIIKTLDNEDMFFRHYVVAMILRYFPEVNFDDIKGIFKEYRHDKDRHWLPRYYMITWLLANEKCDLIRLLKFDNYFLKRQINNAKFHSSKDTTYLEEILMDGIKDVDSHIALHSMYLHVNSMFSTSNFSDDDVNNCNKYIKHILDGNFTTYIQEILRLKMDILNSESFFNIKIWDEDEIYSELNLSFRLFFENIKIDPSKSLLNLNSFNHLIFDKICANLNINKPAKEYGSNLHSGCIQEKLPQTHRYFFEINSDRNQRTEAHPYNKFDQIRNRITVNELEELVKKEVRSLKEICDFYN
jgi:hypothetical protein